MNYEELLAYLELEDPVDFQYFETMADLIECEEYIEPEALYQLFEGVDRELMVQLLDDYFEEVLDGLPEDAGEIYSLLDQIKLSLEGMFTGAEDEDDIRKLSDEFYRFRTWYVEESEVELEPEDGGPAFSQCLRDAITSSRTEKLDGDRYRYDFSGAMDYELDDYSMSFADLIAAGEEE